MRLSILGTRGIPARHGGFETFAQNLAVYLVSRGWEVTVYCQEMGSSPAFENSWQGVRLVHIPVNISGTAGTVIFDLKSTLCAAKTDDLILTLGYNTAVFCAVYRARGIPNLMNMDGLEWRRGKWGLAAKAWLYLNEWAGAWFANHLIADHPEIRAHLATRVSERKITMIPYGAHEVGETDAALLEPFTVRPHRYALVIARPEPENSILEIVSAFSRGVRGMRLVVLGELKPTTDAYHKKVLSSASDEVVFPGAIYETEVLNSLRYHARLYVHGHTVGGCNPSLVEALGASSPILAHDNPFNRWVAGPNARYFRNENECSECFDTLLLNDDRLKTMRKGSRERYQEAFTWDQVLQDYKNLLMKWAINS